MTAHWRPALGFAGMTLVFGLLSWLALYLYWITQTQATIRPAVGVALALCFVLGRTQVWRIVMASVIGAACVRITAGAQPAWLALLTASLNSAPIPCAYFLSQWFNRPTTDFRDWKKLTAFSAAAMASSVVTGLFFWVLVYRVIREPLWQTFQIWLVPSVLSFVVYTPLIVLAWTVKPAALWAVRMRLGAALLLVLAWLGANLLVPGPAIEFLLPLVLVVVALVADVEGTALCLLVIEVAMTAAAVLGVGPGASHPDVLARQINHAQLMCGALTVVLLPAAAAIAQGRRLSSSLTRALQREAHDTMRLRESEARYRRLADHASDMIFQTGEDGLIAYASPSVRTILGYEVEEVIGKSGIVLVLEEDWPLILENRRRSQEADQGYVSDVYQYRVRHKNGAILWCENRQSVVRDSDGRLLGYVSVVRDITERHKHAAEMAEMHAKLVHVSRASDMGQMSAAIAHELNQPLAAISNYAVATRRFLDNVDDLPEPIAVVRQITEKIAAQAVRAGNIIRGLQRSLENRQALVVPDELNAILKEAMALTFLGPVGQNVKVRLHLSPTPIPVQVDRVQIQQVMCNMMRNAVEAMQDMPVRDLHLSTGMGGEKFAWFEIADTGHGIPENAMENLFQAFRTTKQGGMGMGLSICKSIVRAHGGDITATNRSSGGACFRVRLPAIKACEPAVEPAK